MDNTSIALLISFGSLLVAAITLFLQRVHNVKTLTPIAHISKGDYEHRIFVKLKNYGTGPLVISKFRAYNSGENYKRVIDVFHSMEEPVMWRTFTDIIDNRVLAPNREFVLLEVDIDESVNINLIRKYLSETTISLEYKDIYGNKQETLTESLAWFKRML